MGRRDSLSYGTSPEETPAGYIHPMSSPRFEVVAPFEPAGDQPKAIAELTQGLRFGETSTRPSWA